MNSEKEGSKKARMASNIERNEKLYRYWKEGKTIREAALLSGVPEGTVSYYWRKFNRAAQRGRPIVIGKSENEDRVPENASNIPKKKSRDELASSYYAKIMTIFAITQDFRSWDPVKRLEFMQKMVETQAFPTSEESNAVFGNTQSTNLSNSNSTGTSKKFMGSKSNSSPSKIMSDLQILDFLSHSSRWRKDHFLGDVMSERDVPPEVAQFLLKNQKVRVTLNSKAVLEETVYELGEYDYWFSSFTGEANRHRRFLFRDSFSKIR